MTRVHYSKEMGVQRGRFSRSAKRRGLLRLRTRDWFGPWEFMDWYRVPWKKAR